MKHYMWCATVLVTLLFVVRVLAQEDEAQLDEYLRKPAQKAGTLKPASLDRAFREMYDLNFAKADSELARFNVERPTDPLGPAAQAASALFFIFAQHKILQSELFTSDDRYQARQPLA